MIRFVMTGLLVAASMVAARAEEKTKTKTPSAREVDAVGESSREGSDSTQRVFELRTYYTNDGKLVDLHKRFRDHTCELLKKHGAELIGFWTPTDEKNGKGSKLIYLVAFPSREAAKKTWEAFGNDPEWKKARDESHKNGVLVKRWIRSSSSRPITVR